MHRFWFCSENIRPRDLEIAHEPYTVILQTLNKFKIYNHLFFARSFCSIQRSITTVFPHLSLQRPILIRQSRFDPFKLTRRPYPWTTHRAETHEELMFLIFFFINFFFHYHSSATRYNYSILRAFYMKL